MKGNLTVYFAFRLSVFFYVLALMYPIITSPLPLQHQNTYTY